MTYNELRHRLTQVYDAGEAQAIARMVYELRFGLSLSDICIGKDAQLSADCQAQLEDIAQRLLKQEPVQYVLGEATFAGRTYKVTPDVLIPRPETAELCQWITTTHHSPLTTHHSPFTILDIGTGSGCIAITLALAWPEADVTAWDISPAALTVARENVARLSARVTFEQVDALHIPPSALHLPPFTLIVSNPPYICNKEREAMEANVLDWEPHGALFVPDDDPLLFYRAIARYALQALEPQGWLYFEINPPYAKPLSEMLRMMSFHDIEIKEDTYGKQRMIRAQR